MPIIAPPILAASSLPTANQPFTVDYFPTVDGELFDPANGGGSVTSLKLYADSTRSGSPVGTYGPAVKIADGQYRFTVPAPGVPATVYWTSVVYSPDGTSVVTDADNTLLVYPFDGSFGSGSLANLDDLKTQLRIDLADLTYDTQLQGFLDAATSWIEDLVGAVLQVQKTERHVPTTDTIVLRTQNVHSITSMVEYIGGSSYTYIQSLTPIGAAQFAFTQDPSIPSILKRVGQAGPIPWNGFPVDVVFTTGLSQVPPEVRLASLMFAGALWQDTQQGFEVDDLGNTPAPNIQTAQGQIVDLLRGRLRGPGLG